MTIRAPLNLPLELVVKLIEQANQLGHQGKMITGLEVIGPEFSLATNTDSQPAPVPDRVESASPVPSAKPTKVRNSRSQNDAPSEVGTSVVEDHKSDTADIDEPESTKFCPHCREVRVPLWVSACPACRDAITPVEMPSKPCARCRKTLVRMPDTLCFDCKERDLRRTQGESAAAKRRAQAPPASPTPTGENGQV